MTEINKVTLDDQELKAIIYCINNGKQLDEYEIKVVEKLQRIQQLRLDYKMATGNAEDILTKIAEEGGSGGEEI